MNRFRYSIVVLIISIFTTNAQNSSEAEKVINNLLNTAKTNAIKTDFKLSVTEKNAVNSQSNVGSFIIKDNKFALEMQDLKAWYDGKTQWAYVQESNEVSITEPTQSELAETNPMVILAGYKAKCNLSFSKSKSAQNYIVDMIPKQKNNDFTKIEVQVNKSSGNLISIKLTAKKGTTTLLSLSNYQKGVKISDDAFVFNKTKFKGVSINDLR